AIARVRGIRLDGRVRKVGGAGIELRLGIRLVDTFQQHVRRGRVVRAQDPRITQVGDDRATAGYEGRQITHNEDRRPTYHDPFKLSDAVPRPISGSKWMLPFRLLCCPPSKMNSDTPTPVATSPSPVLIVETRAALRAAPSLETPSE